MDDLDRAKTVGCEEPSDRGHCRLLRHVPGDRSATCHAKLASGLIEQGVCSGKPGAEPSVLDEARIARSLGIEEHAISETVELDSVNDVDFTWRST
jgi:hypothetical protein